MTSTVIAGGGTAGLALALALGARGHRVRVLERSEPPPDGPVVKSAEVWERPSVPQAGHDHILNALGVRMLRSHAPAVLDAALAEGARLADLTTAAPPGPAEPGDEELVTLLVRRCVLDLVLHRAVRALPRVTVSHRTTVAGVLTAPSGPTTRRVTGVVTDRGERVPADLVVDASGRRSASRSWLAAAGFPAAGDLTGPSRLHAFGRFYRLRDPGGPPPGPLNRANAAGGIWDHYSAVLHPADNDVFAITFGALPGDRAMAALRTPAAFTAACRLSPYLAAWVEEDAARPLGPVRAIAMPPNILRGAGPGRQRPVAGLLRVGDAACVTDPMFGRGLSLALAHAFRLADLIGEDPVADEWLGLAAADLADRVLRPWYELGAHDSRLRAERWRAAAGAPPVTEPDPPAPPVPPVPEPVWNAALAAAAGDRRVWRGITRIGTSLAAPAEVFADPEFLARVRAAAPGTPAPAGPRPPTYAGLRRTVTAHAPDQEEG
ncbi:FAD-dependent monooxygenase [Streptomyces flavotricini]|uniref:FAD-dependent monooxygenase n=1 Tax=Streptomyces flavotricini TaxID=66888 RepID=A0ABS8E4R9_9ACTN|nr:FAD-dependent monooxygenase [Streptomyces flavotricini]MCC0095970.1 FAD-dependent monooxygenase [Streptomyces flavotricini]